MKILSLFLLFLLFINNCYAYEKCDHNFFGNIPVKYKSLRNDQFGNNLADIYYVDSSGNLLNGYICLYKNAILVSRQYVVNGKLNGKGQGFYENGNIKWDAEYKNGLVNGYSRSYHSNGEVEKIFHYIDGLVISAECANGYKWTENEVNKWNQGGVMRNSVRNICINK